MESMLSHSPSERGYTTMFVHKPIILAQTNMASRSISAGSDK